MLALGYRLGLDRETILWHVELAELMMVQLATMEQSGRMRHKPDWERGRGIMERVREILDNADAEDNLNP